MAREDDDDDDPSNQDDQSAVLRWTGRRSRVTRRPRGSIAVNMHPPSGVGDLSAPDDREQHPNLPYRRRQHRGLLWKKIIFLVATMMVAVMTCIFCVSLFILLFNGDFVSMHDKTAQTWSHENFAFLEFRLRYTKGKPSLIFLAIQEERIHFLDQTLRLNYLTPTWDNVADENGACHAIRCLTEGKPRLDDLFQKYSFRDCETRKKRMSDAQSPLPEPNDYTQLIVVALVCVFVVGIIVLFARFSFFPSFLPS